MGLQNLERRGAQAVLDLQPSSSMAVSYHPLFGAHSDIILLEVDEKLLPEILHQRVVVRGQPEEDAILCTRSKTYAMKFVGTSNSVFLVPPSDQPEFIIDDLNINARDQNISAEASVVKIANGTMELVEVAPGLDKLKTLLSKNPYRFEEDSEMEDPVESESESDRGLYYWDDLGDRVQASDDELRSALQALSAIEIDGYWRILDAKYMDMILRMILHNSVLNDWSLDSLEHDKVVEALLSDGFPCKITEHCLSVYGNKVIEGTETSSIWKLDDRKVCVHFAREILRDGKRKMESFVEEWERKVPEGMNRSFSMLEGEVLTEKFGVETWVEAFSISSLPLSPSERFSVLFKKRPKWEWNNLQPYIRDLNVPGLSLEGLLLKHTRKTQPKSDAEPIFSAR